MSLPPDVRAEAAKLAFDIIGPNVTTAKPIPLRDFIKLGWHVIEPATPYVHNWHIDAIADHLEAVTSGDIRDLIISVPPRHAKSTIVSVLWPAWFWTIRPETRFLCASYDMALSVRDARRHRQVVESPWYQERWGHVVKLSSDQNQKRRFENTATGYRIATSTNSSGGTGEGGDIILCDDPHDARKVRSEPIRKAVHQWWRETMSTRANDPNRVARVFIAQRTHHDDLSSVFLAETPDVVHLCLPARYVPTTYVTPIGFQDPRSIPGELLWKDRFQEKDIAELERKLGPYAAAAQLQQSPTPLGGGAFKEYWWKYWYPLDMDANPPAKVRRVGETGEPVEIEQVALPRIFDTVIASWDMSFKNKDTSDWCVGQVWGVVDGCRYLLFQVRARMSFTEAKAAVKTLAEAWPDACPIYIEEAANGIAVIDDLRDTIPSIQGVPTDGGKQARAAIAEVDVSNGKVYLPHPEFSPWVNEFVREHSHFPLGEHDDQVDAHAHAARQLRRVSQPLSFWGGSQPNTDDLWAAAR